ncbi:MAG: hypothetical protein PHX21_12630 [bacterium]|nr:hypothetical protein [bacterium]
MYDLKIEPANNIDVQVKLELYPPVVRKPRDKTKTFDDVLQTCRNKTLEELKKNAINTRGERC